MPKDSAFSSRDFSSYFRFVGMVGDVLLKNPPNTTVKDFVSKYIPKEFSSEVLDPKAYSVTLLSQLHATPDYPSPPFQPLNERGKIVGLVRELSNGISGINQKIIVDGEGLKLSIVGDNAKLSMKFHDSAVNAYSKLLTALKPYCDSHEFYDRSNSQKKGEMRDPEINLGRHDIVGLIDVQRNILSETIASRSATVRSQPQRITSYRLQQSFYSSHGDMVAIRNLAEIDLKGKITWLHCERGSHALQDPFDKKTNDRLVNSRRTLMAA